MLSCVEESERESERGSLSPLVYLTQTIEDNSTQTMLTYLPTQSLLSMEKVRQFLSLVPKRRGVNKLLVRFKFVKRTLT